MPFTSATVVQVAKNISLYSLVMYLMKMKVLQIKDWRLAIIRNVFITGATNPETARANASYVLGKKIERKIRACGPQEKSAQIRD